jgi:hypothetical protein
MLKQRHQMYRAKGFAETSREHMPGVPLGEASKAISFVPGQIQFFGLIAAEFDNLGIIPDKAPDPSASRSVSAIITSASAMGKPFNQ